MTFKPFCNECLSWHTDTEGHIMNIAGLAAAHAELVATAVAAERERCAQIAEAAINDMNGQRKAGMARAIARRIRDDAVTQDKRHD